MLAKKAQCSPAVAIHALLVCTGVPAHAYAYLIGKNDGNLPKEVHVWTCEEDKVMQAVSNTLPHALLLLLVLLLLLLLLLRVPPPLSAFCKCRGTEGRASTMR